MSPQNPKGWFTQGDAKILGVDPNHLVVFLALSNLLTPQALPMVLCEGYTSYNSKS